MKPVIILSIASSLVVSAAALDTSGLLGAPKVAHAEEDVEALRSTSVMAEPGEKAIVVTRVRAGDKMSVLSRKGRWLKVRVNGRTGWVTQTSVSSNQTTPERDTRRRPFVEGRSDKRKGPDSGPRDRVGADTIKGAEGSLADKDEKDEWDGDIVSGATEGSTDYANSSDGEDEFITDEGPGDVEAPKKGPAEVTSTAAVTVAPATGIRIYGALGFSAMSQDFSTPEECELCNYELNSGALAVALGGDYAYPIGNALEVAADLQYRFTNASPGIAYAPEGGTPVDIGFQSHQVDVGARAAYKFSPVTGMAAYGRLGYHYNTVRINDVQDLAKNVAKLPSESLAGPTIGVGFDMPRISPKLGVHLGFNYLIAGTREQTPGLEDGNASDAQGMWATASVAYEVLPKLSVSGQYHYSGASTAWTGAAAASSRDHGAAEANRDDSTHTIFLGVARAL